MIELISGRHRFGQTVANLDIPGNAEKRKLDIAHKSHTFINILRDDKNVVLVVQIGFLQLLSGLIDAGNQCCSAAATWVVDRNITMLFDLLDNILHRYRRHKLANMVRCKYLLQPLTAEIQLHIHTSEKILFGVFFQGHNGVSKQFGKQRLFFFPVFADDFQISFLPLLEVGLIDRI